jgi:hypothetical protein
VRKYFFGPKKKPFLYRKDDCSADKVYLYSAHNFYKDAASVNRCYESIFAFIGRTDKKPCATGKLRATTAFLAIISQRKLSAKSVESELKPKTQLNHENQEKL